MSVLSHYQVTALGRARRAGQAAAETSLDLGLNAVTAALTAAGVEFPAGERLSWPDAERIQAAEVNCFYYQDAAWREIKTYSEETERVYSLMPTRRAPTLLISGLPMHRIKDVDPWEDTQNKIRAPSIAVPATPPKPRNAARMATTRKTIAY